MVSAPDSGSRGLGLSPGRVIVLHSLARHFTLTVHLWVPVNMLGGKYYAMHLHFIREEKQYSKSLHSTHAA